MEKKERAETENIDLQQEAANQSPVQSESVNPASGDAPKAIDEEQDQAAGGEAVPEMEAPTADSVETEDQVEIVDQQAELAKILVGTEQKLKEAEDKNIRAMAEFENFRKRTVKEKALMRDNGAKEVLEKLLPVVDNFDRALAHITEAEQELAISKGVEMIYKQLWESLGELGVKEIEALNQPFDPDRHHAVSHDNNDEMEDNMVIDVYQKGYLYKDMVLRYAMVKVVN